MWNYWKNEGTRTMNSFTWQFMAYSCECYAKMVKKAGEKKKLSNYLLHRDDVKEWKETEFIWQYHDLSQINTKFRIGFEPEYAFKIKFYMYFGFCS